jgi:glycine cleavage system H protein
MGALLAVSTFAFFILLDYLLSRRAAHRHATEEVPAPAAALPTVRPDPGPRLEPVWVAGYDLPEPLHYHRGHTWARVVDQDTVAVGIDDFARRLTGAAKGVTMPKVGQYVRQGGKGATLELEGRAADLIAPVDGEVVEVNKRVLDDPSTITDDPYDRGWLFKVRSTNLPASLRNLLSGSLARRWIEDSKEQLELRLMALSGSVLQDGGEPAPDFANHLETGEWKALIEQFLLTEGYGR